MNKLSKLMLAGVLSLAASGAFAATITGTLNLTGAYLASGGTDLSDATMIDLSGNPVNATGASDDFLLTITFPPVTGIGSSASVDAFVPVTNFLTIGGWQLDLSTLTVTDQSSSLLSLA